MISGPWLVALFFEKSLLLPYAIIHGGFLECYCRRCHSRRGVGVMHASLLYQSMSSEGADVGVGAQNHRRDVIHFVVHLPQPLRHQLHLSFEALKSVHIGGDCQRNRTGRHKEKIRACVRKGVRGGGKGCICVWLVFALDRKQRILQRTSLVAVRISHGQTPLLLVNGTVVQEDDSYLVCNILSLFI